MRVDDLRAAFTEGGFKAASRDGHTLSFRVPMGSTLNVFAGARNSEPARALRTIQWRYDDQVIGESLGVTVPMVNGAHYLTLTIIDWRGVAAVQTVSLVVTEPSDRPPDS